MRTLAGNGSAAMSCVLTVVALLQVASTAAADDQRAHVNYMLHCQGCHRHDASGSGDEVPRMKDFLGYFLHSDEGREFVVRVPGVSTSQLPDDQLAELLNWLLRTYSADQLPGDFAPYTETEVGTLRQNPELQPRERRVALLGQLADEKPSLADALRDY